MLDKPLHGLSDKDMAEHYQTFGWVATGLLSIFLATIVVLLLLGYFFL